MKIRLFVLSCAITGAVCFSVVSTDHAISDDAVVLHYWDMDTVDLDGIPQDVVGSLEMSKVGEPALENVGYSSAYTGAGNYLKTIRLGTARLVADIYDEGGAEATALIFGTDDISFSYWSYDDFAGDADNRGPRIFDFIIGGNSGPGFHLSASSKDPYQLNLNLSDVDGNTIKSKDISAFTQPKDIWTHVAFNINRATSEAEVFFDGTSQGTFDITLLTGDIVPSQDMRIGVINDGGNGGNCQTAGLDDLAFYSGLLSQTQITGLAAGTLLPSDIGSFNGDINGDGNVDDADLNLLLSSFNAGGAGGGNPTFNTDDLDSLLTNFGQSGLQPQSVPEPSSLALFVMAATITLLFRRRQ